MGTKGSEGERPRRQGVYPFRVGAPSCVLPRGVEENLAYLAGRVEDVELVLWDGPEASNLPSPEERAALGRLARREGLTFTVHLPSEARLGSADETERRAALDQCLAWMDRCAPLDPFAWVLHLHGDRRGPLPSEDLERWLEGCRRSMEVLVAAAGDPRSLCAETLDYDFFVLEDLVEAQNLGVCLDLGHLVVAGRDVGRYLDRWLDRTGVLHLHGVRRGEDHVSLAFLDPQVRRTLWGALAAPSRPRVVTLEVFSEEDLEDSLRVLEEDWEGRGTFGVPVE